MIAKRNSAEEAVARVKDGMTVGLGSGSTSRYAIEKLGEMVSDGLKIRAVATSRKTEALARELFIPVVDPSTLDSIDIAIDGADEVDQKGNLIKGGGGSLLREKAIAFASKSFHVIVDDSKLVVTLGARRLPVEIIPFAAGLTLKHIRGLGGDPILRKANSEMFITDNGNLIADCQFEVIADPAWLDIKLKMIPGVVETGLFSNKIVTSIFVGYATGETKVISISP